MEEFDYRIRWRASGIRPGGHRSSRLGGGLEFHGHVGLLNATDPRRLDLRASIANPNREWQFRLYRQIGEIGVAVLADLSASMAYAGIQAKPALLARLVRVIARSAQRRNDSFSFVAADENLREDFYLPPTRLYGAVADLAARLEAAPLAGRSHTGLLAAADLLAGRRKLIFLISDFHFPLAAAERLVDALAAHDLVPLVLWDATETHEFPRRGLALLEDAESGRRRAVWLRPGLRSRWQAAMAERRLALQRLFLARGVAPLFVGADFSPETLGEYFLGGA